MVYDNKLMGAIISEMRLKRGLSQEVLSGMAGIARSHLSMIENGVKCASVSTLWRISEALGIRLNELISRLEERAQG